MGRFSTKTAERISQVSPLELRPYAGNARTHSRKQIKAIAAIATANAANIQVTGKAAGLPVVAAVNTGALTAASVQSQGAVSGFTADDEARKKKRKRRLENPLRLAVKLLGYGD
jgi:hypothetical protein